MNRRILTREGWARSIAVALLAALTVASTACSQLGIGGASNSSKQAVQSAPQLAPQASERPSVSPGAPDAAPSLGGAAPSAPRANASAASASAQQQQMIIRNADMRLEVGKVTDAVEKIRSLAKKYSAVIANVNVSTEQGTPAPQPVGGEAKPSTLSSGQPYNGSVTVLVPVARFDPFTDEVRSMGKLITFTTDDQNVTQQHLDMKARLLNLKAEEARLRSFFNDAQSVSDMLSIESQLTRVQGEIESLQAQLTYLERQAAMATLTVELVEPSTLVRPAGIDWGFGTAVTTSIRAFVGTINVIIVVVGAVLPLVIMGVAVFFLVRWMVRRKPRATAAAGTAHAPGEAPGE